MSESDDALLRLRRLFTRLQNAAESCVMNIEIQSPEACLSQLGADFWAIDKDVEPSDFAILDRAHE